MKITIEYFRCISKKIELNIIDNAITLIKGSSGAGKTTILQAIAWCLYGHIRLVNPNNMTKVKTFVSIEINDKNGTTGNENLYIERSKNPNHLRVKVKNEDEYIDAVAQSFIDNKFGEYDIWISSCYINQSARNNFLTASNNDKLSFLHKIAFHEENPSEKIAQIDEKLVTIENDYKKSSILFEDESNRMKERMTNIDFKQKLNKQQRLDLQYNIDMLKTEKLTLQENQKQYNINLGILKSLQSSLLHLTNEIKNLTSLNKPVCPYNSSSLNENELLTLLEKRHEIASRLSNIKPITLPLNEVIYTESDLHDAIEKEKEYTTNYKLAQNLKIVYSDESIQYHINNINLLLKYQNYFNYKKEYDILLEKRNSLLIDDSASRIEIESNIDMPIKVETIEIEKEIERLLVEKGSLENHINHLIKNKDILVCPNCQKNLKHNNSVLYLVEDMPSNEVEIKIAQNSLQELIIKIKKTQNTIIEVNNKYIRDKKIFDEYCERKQKIAHERQLKMQKKAIDLANFNLKIDELQTKLNEVNKPTDPSIEEKILSDKEIAQYNLILAKLSTIKIISWDSSVMTKIKNYLAQVKLNQEYHILQAEYNKIQEQITTDKELTPTILKNYMREMKKYEEHEKQIAIITTQNKKQQQNIIDQINDIEILIKAFNPIIISDKINDITEKIETNNNRIKKADLIDQFQKEYKILQQKHDKVTELFNKMTTLQTLRQYALDVECKILQDTVDSINSSISSVCTTMFDKDIIISLNLFKTLKTTKDVKPGVNFSITYQGGTYDNINQLSGGEADRASLALTLALNKLSSCPLLMLDETFASINLDLKEKAIKSIREQTNSTVLIIVHDGIEGIFDDIIDIEEFF